MCRNIKTLANFEPPATDDEIRASALQVGGAVAGRGEWRNGDGPGEVHTGSGGISFRNANCFR